jgi:transposase
MLAGVVMEALKDECRLGSETIGSLPIVASYLRRIKIAEFVNLHAGSIRSNGRRLSHGDTTFIIMLFLFCRPHVISKVETWVKETMYLKVLYPGISSDFFTEARIGDTLDAIHKAGIDNILFHQSSFICEEFKLNADNVFVDLTNFTVYGEYTGSDDDTAIITYGNAKSKRSDLKQFAQEVAVLGDAGVPIYSKTLNGKTADVTRYWPIWEELRKLLVKTDFLMVGDCKLTSNENLVNISKNEGYYLGPEFRKNIKALRKELKEGRVHETLAEIKKTKNKTVVYSGFETNTTITDPDTNKKYFQRRLYIHSTQLEFDKRATLHRHIKDCEGKLCKIQENASSKKYSSINVLNSAIERVISGAGLIGCVYVCIEETFEIIKKATTRGRPGKNTKYIEKSVNRHQVSFSLNEKAIQQKENDCGYFVLVTNKTAKDLPIQEALQTYKKQHKVENTFTRLKGPLQVIPIRLELERRIESIMYMLVSCVQIMTLIDRTAERTLSSKNKKLYGLFPKNRGVEKPKAEYMMDALRVLTLEFVQFDGKTKLKIGRLNELQLELLELMEADEQLYSKEYCSERLMKAESLNPDEFNHLLNNQILHG